MDSGPRGDNVLWRWPISPSEWLRAGAWVWGRFSIATLSVALGMAIGAGMVTNAYLLRENTANAGVILIDAGMGLLIGVALVLVPASVLYVIGYLLVPRLILTGHDVRVESHLPWRRSQILPRSEIRAVVIYEGDGAMFLMGDGRKILRVRHVGRTAAFAEALAVPTLAWPVRKQSKTSEILTGAEMVCFLILTSIGWAAALILVSIVAASSLGYLSRVFISLAAGPIFGSVLAPTPVLAIARHFVTRQALDDFMAKSLDQARWWGCSPTGWNWLYAFFASGSRLAIRILRFAPPPLLQPVLRHGATPELAAALAAE